MAERSAAGRFLQIRTGLSKAISRVEEAGRFITRPNPFGEERLDRLPPRLRAVVDTVLRILSPGTGALLIRSFLLFVVAPSAVFFLYLALWQSSGYVAEAKVTVRGAQEQRQATSETAALIGKLGSTSKTTVQDSWIVLNYIKSTAIINDLGGRPYLEKYFAAGDIDYFSRLSHDRTIEDLLKYWLKRVAVSVDTVSSVLTLKVEAFRAQEARAIAQDIVERSERLVNNMTLRSRNDALERARQEVSLAADKLVAARNKTTEFRDRSAMIDPASRVQSVSELITKLTMDKITIENSLTTLQGSLGPDAPTQRVQRAKLATITQQIDDLRKSLTDAQNDSAVSSLIASYERLKLDEQFNERMYTIAQNSYERARQELEKQQLYLVTIVPPSAPESATYPKVIASTLLLFGALTVFWAIISLIVASATDQMV